MSLIFRIIVPVKDRKRFAHRLVNFKDNFALRTKFCRQAICLWENSLSECQNRIDVDLPNSWKLEITTYVPAGGWGVMLWKTIAKLNTEDSFCSKEVQRWGKTECYKLTWGTLHAEKGFAEHKWNDDAQETRKWFRKKISCFQDMKKPFVEDLHIS